ncbi:hypothetical protein D3C87_1460470 [compost metagenome]
MYSKLCGSELARSHRVLLCLSDRLQRHGQLNPQPVRSAVEMQRAAAALDDGLDNRQAKTASGALTVTPESLGQVLQVVFGNARPVIAHHKLHTVAAGLQAQLDFPLAGRMAQSVVQQVAQRRNR